jgi:predicted DNA binding CopG/RHH family protein
MKNKNNLTNLTVPLDSYEKELDVFLKKGKYIRAKNIKSVKGMIENTAEEHVKLRESKSITLRVNNRDLIKFKAKAREKNIPYQTLINLLIGNYNKGKTRLSL